MSLDGKVALVAGGRGALGEAVVEELGRAGAVVVIAGRHPPRARPSAPAPASTWLTVDFTDEAAVEALVREVVARHGRLDILVDVVGGYAAGEPVASTESATWRSMIELNLLTAFHLCRAAVRPMLAQKSGRILCIGSRAATRPEPRAAAYAVSKTALVALVETLAAEVVQEGVTVNAVLPSTMDTAANRAAMPDADFTRWVTPAAVARVLRFLADEDGAIISGAAIPVYGRA